MIHSLGSDETNEIAARRGTYETTTENTVLSIELK